MNNIIESLPLATPQEQIWIHQALLPEVPLYNIGGSLRIEGTLSLDAFEMALRKTVAEADALRIILHPTDAVARQEFREQVEVGLRIHDFSDQANPEQSARDWMLGQFTVPFELYGSPLFNFALIRVSPTRQYWFCKYHHIIIDGWGISLVMQRVVEHYAAVSQGREISRREARSYKRFVASEQRYLNSAAYAQDEAYWSTKLRNSPEPLARRAENVVPGASLGFDIKRAHFDELDAFSQTCSSSTFGVMLAAVCTYFARIAGRNDLLLGAPALNRRTAAEKATVGLYAGLRPARFSFNPAMNALDFLQQVRTELSKDYRHYRFPLGRMSRSDIVHDAVPTTLLDVILSFERHNYDATMNGYDVHMEALPNGFEQNGLLISVRDYHKNEDVHVDLSYNSAAFSAQDIEGVIDGLQCLIEGIYAHPQRALGRLNLVPREDRVRMLEALSAGASEESSKGCVHDYVSEWARRDPARCAVRDGETRLSYGELEERANGLAWRLQQAGVGPDVCVGICLRNSPVLLIAVLAVLKAGGAYVPIEESHPRERVRWMVRDARVALVLSEPGELAWLAAEGIRRVEVSEPAMAKQGPPVRVLPEHLAYVIYTSGSTGRPKGVMVSHASIINYLRFSVARYGLTTEPDAVPLHSSLGFDATATSLWAPLLAGGCIEILPRASGLASLAEAMRGGRDFNLVKVTPSHLSVLAEEIGWALDWARPRLLVIGGEPLSYTSLKFWRRHAPDTRIVNEYGPTEAAVGCCVFEMQGRASRESERGGVPIGRPIWNTRLYVLDEGMEPVPVGVVGELYIGGAGLARGYLGRAGLTAERFVPDPFSGKVGARLYRSGDQVRYDENGNLEFVGRRDRQVKLRGHRIELGEVEAVMRSHPSVREVAVQLDENGSAGPRLIGYVVAGAGAAPGTEELKRHARQRLTEVMVPSVWMVLERLPLTVNGKVDYRQLPPVRAEGTAAAAVPETGPRTPLERELTAIWSEVLDLRHLGPNDNFFDLGGDSILALRIVGRARGRGIRLDPDQIFKHQTVASLATVARYCAHRESDASTESAVGYVSPTPVQQWLLDQDLPDPNYYSQVVELEVSPGVGAQQLESILSLLVARHDAFRLRIARRENGWIQCVAESESARLLTVEQLDDTKPEDEDVFFSERLPVLQRGIDLSSGPLLQGLLCLSRRSGPSRLFLAAHHVAIDLVSWRIVLDEIDTLCRQIAAGGSPRLASLPTSFSSWARQLERQAASPAVADDAAYWQRFLGVDTALLPRDLNGLAGNTVGSSCIVRKVISRDLTAQLLSTAPRAYRCRVDELLLTAVARAIALVTGRESIFVELEAHGRDAPFEICDLAQTVGWFTSIYPVRLKVSTNLTSRVEMLAEIESQMSAIPNHGHSFGLLRYLATDADTRVRLASIPRAELVFNYLGEVDRGTQNYGDWFGGIKSLGLARSDAARRAYVLELEISVMRQELSMSWTFSTNLHYATTIGRVAEVCLQELVALVTQMPSDNAHGFTPSDFPAARLDQRELDTLLQRLR